MLKTPSKTMNRLLKQANEEGFGYLISRPSSIDEGWCVCFDGVFGETIANHYKLNNEEYKKVGDVYGYKSRIGVNLFSCESDIKAEFKNEQSS